MYAALFINDIVALLSLRGKETWIKSKIDIKEWLPESFVYNANIDDSVMSLQKN